MLGKFLLTGACLLTSCTLFAQGIMVNNNTSAYGTARKGVICSGSIGDEGIIQPKTSKYISEDIINSLCPDTCSIQVFMNRFCMGKAVATIKLDIKNRVGITNVANVPGSGYVLDGSGFVLNINKT